jgi:hypothetical protein
MACKGRKQQEEQEEESEFREFRVYVSGTYYQTHYVTARNQEEAADRYCEGDYWDSSDMDYDHEEVTDIEAAEEY